MRQTTWAILLVVGALTLATLACGGSDNSGVKVDDAAPAPTKEPPKVVTYSAGDVIEVKDHTIVLNTAELSGSVLQANFTIENKGSDDLNVSTLLSFSVKDDEGTKLETEIFECGASLGGTILAGDKSKGDICWKATGNNPYKIYYEASLLGSGAIVWQVDP